MQEPEGLEQLGGEFGEIGTKASGFADSGPYHCMNCVWKKHVNETDVCTHPVVNADPELKDRQRTGDFLIVDWDDCCRYVRPPSDEDEDG